MRRADIRPQSYLTAARRLRGVGATWGSILRGPFRRRSSEPRCQIDFADGLTLAAPLEVPLLNLCEEILRDRCYTPRGMEPSRGSMVIDIGANVGVFSVLAAAAAVRVIAIEPSARACHFLRRNVAANQLRNVEVIEAACAGTPGERLLYSRGSDVTNTLHPYDYPGSHFHPVGSVPTITLDQVFARYAVDRSAFVKLDCEGAEYEILLAVSDATLARIDTITMEYHQGLDHTPDELCSFLSAKGFQVKFGPVVDAEDGYLQAWRQGRLVPRQAEWAAS